MALTKVELGILGGLLVAGVAVPVLIQHRSNSVSAQADPALAESELAAQFPLRRPYRSMWIGMNVEDRSANPVPPRSFLPSQPEIPRYFVQWMKS